jgi:hypothetical protein
MKTIDVRVLLNDDEDVERFVERLGMAARHFEVLGATLLVPDDRQYENGCGDYLVPSQVYTRPGIEWDGKD